jgi:pyrroline-5-carboxylate reductase
LSLLGSLTAMNGTRSELTFVGGGNMGSAIVSGLLKAEWSPSSITIVESSAERRVELERMFPGVRMAAEIGRCTAAVIAVKPGAAANVCGELARAGAQRVLSIAAGVSVDALQREAGNDCVVVRSMPNTPALVGEGVSAICGSERATKDDLAWAKSILGAVGTVVEVEERLIDAVTAISGSGPAYLFLFAEALIEAGRQHGLPLEIADALVRQLLVGSGRLLQESGENPAELRRKVTSPNGVTAAAIATLEEHGFRDAVFETVRSAVQRSREMGQ